MNEHNEECRAIVMEYLLHYCYKNTAKSLLKELRTLDKCSEAIDSNQCRSDAASIDSRVTETTTFFATLDEVNIEWNHIDARKNIHDAIKQGDIGRAFTLIETHFSQLIRTYNTLNRLDTSLNKTPLPKSHYVLYKLRCQQFIEILRTSGDLEAIQFAQRYLRPCSKLYPELTQSVTTLIAYKELENEKTKDLLSQDRRDMLADQVNEMILESQHFSPRTALEKVWRQKAAIQVELDNQKRKESSQNQKESASTEKAAM